MDEQPGIVFRDGPTGPRAALAAGPDVWELVRFMRRVRGDKAVAAIAELLNLTPGQIQAALDYYIDAQEEIDERIRASEEAAERAAAAWRAGKPLA